MHPFSNPTDEHVPLNQWFSTFSEAGPPFVFKKILGTTRTTTCQKYSIVFFSVITLLTIMGVGRIFSRGGSLWDFSKIFLGVQKVAKFLFFLLEIKKKKFLLEF